MTGTPYDAGMRIRAAAMAAVVACAVAGCGESGSGSSVSTASASAVSRDTTEVAAPPTPVSSCEATPTGAFGLTKVEVTNGGRNVTWHTNTPIPAAGAVAFTLTAGNLMRGLKYLDGKVIANYLSHTSTGAQDNVSNPPTVGDGGKSYRVVIPPLYVTDLADAGSWTADLEVMDGTSGMESTGKCSS